MKVIKAVNSTAGFNCFYRHFQFFNLNPFNNKNFKQDVTHVNEMKM